MRPEDSPSTTTAAARPSSAAPQLQEQTDCRAALRRHIGLLFVILLVGAAWAFAIAYSGPIADALYRFLL